MLYLGREQCLIWPPEGGDELCRDQLHFEEAAEESETICSLNSFIQSWLLLLSPWSKLSNVLNQQQQQQQQHIVSFSSPQR